jgi:indole-3-glycerol phosphate synthase
MSDILARICADKRAEIARRKAAQPLAAVEAAARAAPAPRGFAARLAQAAASGGYGLIAEIKRASPSKGLIRADFAPAPLARAYQRGGASCLSVLTDAPYFQGKDTDLGEAREATTLPVLRKDFMLDTYQVAEARALGADCILVIMAAVDDATARALAESAAGFGMDSLVEVHDVGELERALALPAALARLVGVNNRNLKTLAVDLATTEALAPRLPKDRLLVCESGISRPADLTRMAKAGARCFLVGEALMAQADVEAATRALLAREAAAPSRARA